MLLNAVIIILREVIEASLIISVFLAYSPLITKSRLWLFIALGLGLFAAIAYAANISSISQWQEGVGQELLNASINLALYVVLLLFIVLALHPRVQQYTQLMIAIMIMGTVLAITREGSEVILYIHGFVSIPDLLQPVLIGSVIGAGIGISVGVFFYYLLVSLPFKNGLKLGYILTLLVAASMVLQATQLLIQADWLVSQYPLWDTSSWISERSITGQLLYALLGYESTPTAIQVISYCAAIIIMIGLSSYSYFSEARLNK